MTKIQIYITFALLGILTVLQIISVALLVRQDGALQPMSADAKWGYEKKYEPSGDSGVSPYGGAGSNLYGGGTGYPSDYDLGTFPNERICANPDQPC